MGKEAVKVTETSAGSKILRVSLMVAGLISTSLAVLGIFLPLLPTVPLLLLAAACFARSSSRLHSWLLGHRQLGPLISGYLDGQGVPRRTKAGAIVLIWLTITPTAFLVTSLILVRLVLMTIALAVTLYLLWLPTSD